MRIEQVKDSDAGSYSCHASNGIGQDLVAHFSLIVKGTWNALLGLFCPPLGLFWTFGRNEALLLFSARVAFIWVHFAQNAKVRGNFAISLLRIVLLLWVDCFWLECSWQFSISWAKDSQIRISIWRQGEWQDCCYLFHHFWLSSLRIWMVEKWNTGHKKWKNQYSD